MNAYKDRIAETERVKERKRARVERGAGDVPMDPGNRDDRAGGGSTCGRHLAVTSEKHQHEEDRMRDIRVNIRGSGAVDEEQLGKLMKIIRFEQEAPSAAASSDPTVALEYLASGETQESAGVRTCAEVRSC